MSGKDRIRDDLNEIFKGLKRLYESNSLSDLPLRIGLCKQALGMISKEVYPDQWTAIQIDLATCLLQTRVGERAKHIEQSIHHYQQALEVVTRESNSERWALIQFNLAGAYYKRILGKRAENLEQGLEYCESALNVYTRENFPHEWAQTKNTLGEIYRVRIRGVRRENIEEAIRHFQEALEVHNKVEFPRDWAMLQNNLAAAYPDRILGERAENIEKSILHAKLAIEIRNRESDAERWAMTQHNLGHAYRYRIREDPAENIEQAIHYFQQALEVRTRKDLPQDWAETQNNMGDAYLGRIHGESSKNIQKAIGCFEQALEVYTEKKFPEYWAQVQCNLGNAYLGSAGDRAKNIENAINYYEQALRVRTHDMFPEDWAQTHNNLAGAYTDRIQGKKSENIEQVIYHYQQALKVYTIQGFPDLCVKASRSLGNLAFEERRWGLARNAYEQTFAAQNLLMQTSLTHEGKQVELGEVQNLPARAAYACIHGSEVEQKDVERAVEVLEQGRAQLLRESLERRRSDLKQLPRLGFRDLHENYQQAMNQYEMLQLQRKGASEYARLGDLISEMEQALEKVQSAVVAIREVVGGKYPQYRYFLQALPFSEIQKQAQNKPLIYLSATSVGGLALIVTKRGVRSCELPKLAQESLFKHFWSPSDEEVDRINAHLQQGIILPEDIETVKSGYFSMYALWSLANTSSELNKAWLETLNHITHWLWNVAIGDLISVLKKEHCEAATLIPVGYLALLPLHAAWIEDESKPTHRRYALDEINFIYAPSAHALWQTSLTVEPPTKSLMVVDDPDGTLPGAHDEAQTALSMFIKASHLPGKKATMQAVKAEMQKANVLHFATHGHAGWQKEEQAGLKLVDGDLTLSDIFELRLHQTRLAVLSACETGVPGLKLIDEMIGLPAGMMQAGVPGVVGSLWAVADGSTALLMKRFYKYWLEDGKSPQDALRQAQIWLRDKLLLSPYYWAAFTYTGVWYSEADMSKKEIESIPQIAQILVDHLPEEMNVKLKDLISLAENGQDTTIEIVDLFAQYEATRDWMKEQIASLNKGRGGGAPTGYSGLAGNPAVPFSRRWVCPIEPRNHWKMVIQADEEPPACELDKVVMVHGSQ